MRPKNALVWVVVIAAAEAALWKLSGHDFTAARPGPPPAPPAVPVVAGKATAQNVPVFVRGLGTVQAFQTVTVRTRVDGQITKVLFTEGQEVKAGDPLFQIDSRPFQAALEQAQAQKTRDEAQLKGAQLGKYCRVTRPATLNNLKTTTQDLSTPRKGSDAERAHVTENVKYPSGDHSLKIYAAVEDILLAAILHECVAGCAALELN